MGFKEILIHLLLYMYLLFAWFACFLLSCAICLCLMHGSHFLSPRYTLARCVRCQYPGRAGYIAGSMACLMRCLMLVSLACFLACPSCGLPFGALLSCIAFPCLSCLLVFALAFTWVLFVALWGRRWSMQSFCKIAHGSEA